MQSHSVKHAAMLEVYLVRIEDCVGLYRPHIRKLEKTTPLSSADRACRVVCHSAHNRLQICTSFRRNAAVTWHTSDMAAILVAIGLKWRNSHPFHFLTEELRTCVCHVASKVVVGFVAVLLWWVCGIWCSTLTYRVRQRKYFCSFSAIVCNCKQGLNNEKKRYWQRESTQGLGCPHPQKKSRLCISFNAFLMHSRALFVQFSCTFSRWKAVLLAWKKIFKL